MSDETTRDEAERRRSDSDAPAEESRPVTREQGESGDVVTDPARSDQVGSDWTDEGGATPAGPATENPSEGDNEAHGDARKRERSDDDLPPDDLPPITLDPPD